MELDFGEFFVRSLLGNILKLNNASHSKSINVTVEIICDDKEDTDNFFIEDPLSRQMTKTASLEIAPNS